MAEIEGSSAISTTKKFNVKQRLGDRCIICGYPEPVDVAHIIARNQSSNDLLETLRSWSPQLAAFRKDSLENLLVLCPNHHREYDSNITTIVPDAKTRGDLMEHEIRDFAERERIVNGGDSDPGRKLPVEPEFKPTFELVTLKGPDRAFLHMPTPSWPWSFIHDSRGLTTAYPDQYWPLLVYPIILAAYQPLSKPKPHSPKAELARSEVTELVRLYNKRITPILPEAQGVAASQSFQAELGLLDRFYPVRDTTSIQESPDNEMDATAGGLGEESGQPASVHTSTDGTQSQLEHGSPMEVGTKYFLTDDDPVVTPAVLSTRLHFDVVRSEYGDVGSMRFATSSDFVKGTNGISY